MSTLGVASGRSSIRKAKLILKAMIAEAIAL